jgi:ditrans,polycis-polyprenyl diphosphate synthase
MENYLFRDYITFRFLTFLRYFHECGHLSFIMDGNRRYAKQLNLKTENYGHIAGTKTFKNLVNYTILSGINEITVYAFSIENFRRSEEEVGFLMGLAEKQLDQINER